VTEVLEDSVWPSLLVAALLYSLDYALTLVTARLYHARAKSTIAIEGSFELNPLFAKDIDARRRVSPRFLIGLTAMLGMLALLWHVTVPDGSWPAGFLFVFGGLVLLQAALQMRHLRNLVLFATGFGPGGITGHVVYPRRVVLQTSSFEFLTFAALFALLFLLTGSWLVIGGAVTCSGVAIKQCILAWRHRGGKGGAAQRSDAPDRPLG
jgi:hypothetical protein